MIRGAGRGAVQRHLDREHLGIAARLAEEALDRGRERLVGVLQQDRAGLADDVEDVAAVLEHRVGDRVVDRVVQRGQVERRDLHQVAQAEQPLALEHVLALVEAELGGEHAAMHRIDAVADLEAHDRRELALAQLGLDHRDQVVGVLLVALGVGVAGDAEELAAVDLHAREQEVEVVRHDLLERHEGVAGRRPAGSAACPCRPAP